MEREPQLYARWGQPCPTRWSSYQRLHSVELPQRTAIGSLNGHSSIELEDQAHRICFRSVPCETISARERQGDVYFSSLVYRLQSKCLTPVFPPRLPRQRWNATRRRWRNQRCINWYQMRLNCQNLRRGSQRWWCYREQSRSVRSWVDLAYGGWNERRSIEKAQWIRRDGRDGHWRTSEHRRIQY